jgi:protein TonB
MAQPATRPAAPLTLASELAVVCPQHTPPAYPAQSRRLGEQGRVVLRVELDEEGRVSEVRVQTGSGYPRLDDAALAALRSWSCTPAQRDGRAVRAVALQPFNFVLEGR